MCRTLEGHAHWVNTLALNCDYVLRIGPFDPVINPHGVKKDSEFCLFPFQDLFMKKCNFALMDFFDFFSLFSEAELQKDAEKSYRNVVKEEGERLISGSDDFTLFLWHPEKEKKAVGEFK